ncbi:MAG: TRAP transporter small permease [Proteobacteria bacterium]|nr:TRAP transporter small permease [Pseudomonadota bacterium]MBU1060745.1 TRAP transporter small permease [Pseudomonadota bacterium]
MIIRQVGRHVLTFEKRLTDGLLCLLLVTMIVLACLQIGLRTFFSGGLLWADPLLRYLVLWSGMLGAVVATREKKHIGIDVVGYLAPERMKPWIGLGIDLFSASVSVVLTWAAVIFIGNERLYGSSFLLTIPSWIWNLIFPLAFGLISIHFILAIAADIRILVSRVGENERGSGS